MKLLRRIGALLLALAAGGAGRGGEPQRCEPPEEGFFQRLQPVGGWDPYGGGLLHWWPEHCFPCYGGADDYCRKPLPRVCWPPPCLGGTPNGCAPPTRSPGHLP